MLNLIILLSLYSHSTNITLVVHVPCIIAAVKSECFNLSSKECHLAEYPPPKETVEGDVKQIISYEDRDEKIVKVHF